MLDQDLEPRRSRCGFKRKSKFGSRSGAAQVQMWIQKEKANLDQERRSKLNADTDQKHLSFLT